MATHALVIWLSLVCGAAAEAHEVETIHASVGISSIVSTYDTSYVGFEEHEILWSGDKRLFPNGVHAEKTTPFTFAFDDDADLKTAVSALIEAHEDEGLPVDFDVRESGDWVLAVPARVRDEGGEWVVARNALDEEVMLPPGTYAIGDALQRLSTALEARGFPPFAVNGAFHIMDTPVQIPADAKDDTVRRRARHLLLSWLEQVATLQGRVGAHYRYACHDDHSACVMNLGFGPERQGELER